jgi:hypothetical protein
MNKYIVPLLVVLVVTLSFLLYRCKYTEGWVPYKNCPFGNWESAPNSQVYYVQNRYRKPYEWPWTFESSYPVKHQRHFEEKQ